MPCLCSQPPMASISLRRKANVSIKRPLIHIILTFLSWLLTTLFLTLSLPASEPLPFLFLLGKMLFFQVSTWLASFRCLFKSHLSLRLLLSPSPHRPSTWCYPTTLLSFSSNHLSPSNLLCMVCFPFLERKLEEAAVIFCFVTSESSEPNGIWHTVGSSVKLLVRSVICLQGVTRL